MGKGALKGALQGAQDGLISGMVSGAFAGAATSIAGNPMFCFVAGTTVLTTLGKKAIETVKVGDTIPGRQGDGSLVSFFVDIPEEHRDGSVCF